MKESVYKHTLFVTTILGAIVAGPLLGQAEEKTVKELTISSEAQIQVTNVKPPVLNETATLTPSEEKVESVVEVQPEPEVEAVIEVQPAVEVEAVVEVQPEPEEKAVPVAEKPVVKAKGEASASLKKVAISKTTKKTKVTTKTVSKTNQLKTKAVEKKKVTTKNYNLTIKETFKDSALSAAVVELLKASDENAIFTEEDAKSFEQIEFKEAGISNIGATRFLVKS